MWVKICGVRDYAMAEGIAAAGADAIGLNFYEKSPRRVELETARHIVNELSDAVEPVGLFVNHSLEEMLRIIDLLRLGTVQIHGDEMPEQLAGLLARRPDLRVIRAFRVSASEGLVPVHAYLETCHSLGVPLWACLLDAKVEGAYGGTGQVGPWEMIRREYRPESDPPLILAGGLTPENVVDGIRAVQPWGVDTAGGVESSVACKDMVRVRKFLASARSPAR
jgi:phosphoribosylanthranilate isomerase